MKIKEVHFLISSPDVAKCPQSAMNEYAFIGRSNVGKSSLINMLTGRRSLAKTSSLPGKTLLINHFVVDDKWQLVDLPGYGYAKRSKNEQMRLRTMINDYVLQREQLTCLFVLIDIRIPMQKIDLEFINWLGEHAIPFVIVFTKADKVGAQKQRQNISSWMNQLMEYWEEAPRYFVTSSETAMGRDDILSYIGEINKSAGEE